MIDVIKPKPDTRDYKGNLPLFYTIRQNDSLMIKQYFKRNKDYFSYRNYKYETIFHIAAKYNSIEALKALICKTVFIEEMLNKDFKGDTPIHLAAKYGSLEVLEFYLTAVSRRFLEI